MLSGSCRRVDLLSRLLLILTAAVVGTTWFSSMHLLALAREGDTAVVAAGAGVDGDVGGDRDVRPVGRDDVPHTEHLYQYIPTQRLGGANAIAAQKDDITGSPLRNITLPMCLVHIGKAAGSSVSCGLGFAYADCEGMPREHVPKTHFFHMKRNMCADQRQHDEPMRTFIVTLRNPLTRIRSWFDFEKDIVPTRKNQKEQDAVRRQRGYLFSECYSNFTSFVEDGLCDMLGLRRPNIPAPTAAATDSTQITGPALADMACPQRAWAALVGARPISYHEWYNYEHYWNAVKQMRGNASIKVLRSEHMDADWGTISSQPVFRHVNRGPRKDQMQDRAHGSDGPPHDIQLEETASKQPPPQVPKSDQVSSINALTTHGRHALCLGLCDEIQFYKRFLEAADNLDAHQKQQSLVEIQSECPLETLHVRMCPPNIVPSFLPIPIPKRRYLQETKKRFFEIRQRHPDEAR